MEECALLAADNDAAELSAGWKWLTPLYTLGPTDIWLKPVPILGTVMRADTDVVVVVRVLPWTPTLY